MGSGGSRLSNRARGMARVTSAERGCGVDMGLSVLCAALVVCIGVCSDSCNIAHTAARRCHLSGINPTRVGAAALPTVAGRGDITCLRLRLAQLKNGSKPKRYLRQYFSQELSQ